MPNGALFNPYTVGYDAAGNAGQAFNPAQVLAYDGAMKLVRRVVNVPDLPSLNHCVAHQLKTGFRKALQVLAAFLCSLHEAHFTNEFSLIRIEA